MASTAICSCSASACASHVRWLSSEAPTLRSQVASILLTPAASFTKDCIFWKRLNTVPTLVTVAPLRTRNLTMAVVREKMGPGQESVWDYPRPPRLELVQERIRIVFNSQTIVDTTGAYRVLETSHPPVYYIPTEDTNMEFIKKAPGSSFCEWKGNATYWTVSVGGKTAQKVAWSYETPSHSFLPIKGFRAFYAGPMDACFVGEEIAQPQPGGFYGGWITSKVVGPFKGGAGSWGW